MLNKIKKIFKKKPKIEIKKRTYDKAIDHSNDITFENEVKKPVVTETKKTKSGLISETKSSLTFGE